MNLFRSLLTLLFLFVRANPGNAQVSAVIQTDAQFCSMALSPDDRFLAVGELNGRVRAFDLAKKTEIWRSETKNNGKKDAIFAIAISHDGKTVVSGSKSGRLSCWTLASGDLRSESQLGFTISSLVFFKGGTALVVGGYGGRISTWDWSSMKKRKEFRTAVNRVTSISLSPDDKYMAVGGLTTAGSSNFPFTEADYGSIIDAASGKEILKLKEKAAHVSFCDNGRTLLTAGLNVEKIYDGPVSAVDVVYLELATCRPIWSFPGTGTLVYRLRRDFLAIAGGFDVYSHHHTPGGGNLIAPFDNSNSIQFYSIRLQERIKEFDLKDCVSFAVSASGNYLVGAGSRGDFRAWTLSDLPSTSARKAGSLDDAWRDLADGDSRVAYAALQSMVDSKDESVTFIMSRVPKASAPTSARVGEYLSQLESDSFKDRESAGKNLERIAQDVENELRAALDKASTLEMRQRLSPLVSPPPSLVIRSKETLRELRAIWVLEEIGTERAAVALKTISKEAASERVQAEAKAALARRVRQGISEAP